MMTIILRNNEDDDANDDGDDDYIDDVVDDDDDDDDDNIMYDNISLGPRPPPPSHIPPLSVNQSMPIPPPLPLLKSTKKL